MLFFIASINLSSSSFQCSHFSHSITGNSYRRIYFFPVNCFSAFHDQAIGKLNLRKPSQSGILQFFHAVSIKNWVSFSSSSLSSFSFCVLKSSILSVFLFSVSYFRLYHATFLVIFLDYPASFSYSFP